MKACPLCQWPIYDGDAKYHNECVNNVVAKPHNFYVRMLTSEEAEALIDEIDALPKGNYARAPVKP